MRRPWNGRTHPARLRMAISRRFRRFITGLTSTARHWSRKTGWRRRGTLKTRMRRWRRHTELGVAYRRRDAEVHDVSLVCFYYFPFMAVEKDNLEVALQPVEYNRRLHRVAL